MSRAAALYLARRYFLGCVLVAACETRARRSVMFLRGSCGADLKHRPALRHRRPQHLLDARRAGRQHHQTVEAERYAARRRHDRQRVEKILVDRASLAIEARAGGSRLDKTAALLGGIGQFAKAIGDLDAANIKLETLGETRIVRLRARQRRLADGIIGQDRRAPAPQPMLDLLAKNLAEEIRPCCRPPRRSRRPARRPWRARRGRPAAPRGRYWRGGRRPRIRSKFPAPRKPRPRGRARQSCPSRPPWPRPPAGRRNPRSAARPAHARDTTPAW